MLLIVLAIVLFGLADLQTPRNIWAPQYRSRTPEDLAAQFESEGRPVYRHRRDIVRLLELRPGMAVAEIGAGSGFLSRLIAAEVGPSGRATATELDSGMVAYMNRRAAAEGLNNFAAVVSLETATGLPDASMDAIAVVNTYSFFDKPAQMLASMRAVLKPHGLLLIVDFPNRGDGGADPGDVLKAASAAGFEWRDTSTIIPGHYAIRFRRK